MIRQLFTFLLPVLKGEVLICLILGLSMPMSSILILSPEKLSSLSLCWASPNLFGHLRVPLFFFFFKKKKYFTFDSVEIRSCLGRCDVAPVFSATGSTCQPALNLRYGRFEYSVMRLHNPFPLNSQRWGCFKTRV